MGPSEKKAARELIGKYLDIARVRLSDTDAGILVEFITDYAIKYRGRSETQTFSYDGWSSDGKYTRWINTTLTFLDSPGVRMEQSYRDDDGQSGSSSKVITNARAILNILKDRK